MKHDTVICSGSGKFIADTGGQGQGDVLFDQRVIKTAVEAVNITHHADGSVKYAKMVSE